MATIIECRRDYIAEFIRQALRDCPTGIVLSHLDWATLLALSGLWQFGPIETETVRALARGEPVWAPRETLPPPENPPLARRALRRAVELGLCPVGLGELPFWLRYGARRDGVFTAEKARNLLGAGIKGVFLPPSAVVTPLAAEEMRRAGARMVWREKRCDWDGWWERFGARGNARS